MNTRSRTSREIDNELWIIPVTPHLDPYFSVKDLQRKFFEVVLLVGARGDTQFRIKMLDYMAQIIAVGRLRDLRWQHQFQNL